MDKVLSEHDAEFIPLPYYPWVSRPLTFPLDADECATAIHLAKGHVPAAAALLKVPEYKLDRFIRHHPVLQRIQAEEAGLEVHKAAWEYSKALDDPSDRRREWAASKIMASKAAQSHPFSPAPAGSQTNSNVTINQESREIIIHWGDAPALLATPEIESEDGS
jgi:hypothetical protein